MNEDNFRLPVMAMLDDVEAELLQYELSSDAGNEIWIRLKQIEMVLRSRIEPQEVR